MSNIEVRNRVLSINSIPVNKIVNPHRQVAGIRIAYTQPPHTPKPNVNWLKSRTTKLKLSITLWDHQLFVSTMLVSVDCLVAVRMVSVAAFEAVGWHGSESI